MNYETLVCHIANACRILDIEDIDGIVHQVETIISGDDNMTVKGFLRFTEMSSIRAFVVSKFATDDFLPHEDLTDVRTSE